MALLLWQKPCCEIRDAGIKPEYIELEDMAWSAVKARFQVNFNQTLQSFSKVVNVTNMTKIWHWLLDCKLQNVNTQDLHDHAKETEGVA